jgi:pyridoxine kinase
MPRVLFLSSYVACGTVGLQAGVPPLRHAAIDVMAVPTTLLSNHPGHAHMAGAPVAPSVIMDIVEALDGNGWLHDVSAVISGYLPTAQHATVAARAVDLLQSRSPGALYICDPVLGDDPKGLYIDAEAARAIRNDLLPRSGCLTPNRFELAWLSGLPVTSIASAVEAARALGAPMTLATSIPASEDHLANVLVTSTGHWSATVVRRPAVPHGTGDVLTGLFACELIAGHAAADALVASTRILDGIIAASPAQGTLNLSAFY